jgi:hypothetical protein
MTEFLVPYTAKNDAKKYGFYMVYRGGGLRPGGVAVDRGGEAIRHSRLRFLYIVVRVGKL